VRLDYLLRQNLVGRSRAGASVRIASWPASRPSVAVALAVVDALILIAAGRAA
jgi:hypothetical protein